MSFVRNIYSPEEQTAIDAYYKRGRQFAGWMGDEPTDKEPYPIYNWSAGKEIILHQATIADYKNPLHRDEEYAKRTRWGGLIAAPFFSFCVAGGMSFNGLQIPPEVGHPVSMGMGEGWDWIENPIRPGDTFKIWTMEGEVTDLTGDGEQDHRILETHDRFRIYNQKDEVVCVFKRLLTNTYSDPSLPPLDDGYMRMMGLFTGKDLRFTEEKKYTKEEIEAIEEFYWAEKRQGSAIRYWEDVRVGDELYPIELGPITVWETCMTMATFGCVPAPVWHIKEKTPGRIFYDPVTNIPHKNIEFHLDPAFAPKIGIPHFYSSTLIQNSIFDFFGRLLSNWMGDDGFIRKYQWIKFTNTPFGDTVFGYGKVVHKYIDVQGHCLVDIDCWMDNARGFISNTGFSTVELLSREKMNHDKLPDWNDIPRLDPNPDGIKVGDRVRVKGRPDWPLPTPHPTVGRTAKVIEAATNRDLGAYCFIAFDEDITGLDPRIVVGARYDQMEKI